MRELFAEKGFHGATTRELAKAAGISEALMLRHFPTKEVLYAAVLESSCHTDSEMQQAFSRMMALEPSTSSLVMAIHFFFVKLIILSLQHRGSAQAPHKLMLQSIQGDGEFARMMVKQGPTVFVGKIEQCLKAAIKAGDAVDTGVGPNMRAWLAHHVAVMIMLNCLPDTPIIDYGMPQTKVVEQAVAFVLRGMGLTDEAIRRHYNPKALAMIGG